MSYVSPFLAQYDITRLPEEQVFDILDQHYTQLRKFVQGVCNDKYHLIVNGDAGMGKTEITNDVVETFTVKNRIVPVSGTMSPVRLFAKLQEAQHKGHILLVDDTDKVLEDQESLEILKGVMDTRKDKVVDWEKYSTALRKSNKVTSFKFEGRVIIITNKMIRTAPDETPTVQQQRILPVLSRAHYFKAGVPSTQWKIAAIKMHMNHYKSRHEDGYEYVLRCFLNLHPETQDEILQWIEEKQNNLREISFRTCAMLRDLQEEEPDFWKNMALSSMCFS